MLGIREQRDRERALLDELLVALGRVRAAPSTVASRPSKPASPAVKSQAWVVQPGCRPWDRNRGPPSGPRNQRASPSYRPDFSGRTPGLSSRSRSSRRTPSSLDASSCGATIRRADAPRKPAWPGILAAGQREEYLHAVNTAVPTHPIARLPEEWRTQLAARGERAFAAKQVFDWIHKRGVIDAAAMSNLAPRLREALAAEGLAPGLCVPEQVHRSSDGTRKIAARLRDGALIETVLLPRSPARDPRPAATRTTTTTTARPSPTAAPRTPASPSASRRRSAAPWAASSAPAASPA